MERSLRCSPLPSPLRRPLVLGCAIGVVALAACGDNGVAGNTYGGDECFFESIEFKTDDSGYVSQFGMQKEFTYEIDGDRLILKVENDNAVFTIGDDGSLDGGGLIGKCVKIDS